jgi:hypothetical protein
MYGATEIVYHRYLMNRPNRRIHYHVFSDYRYVFRIHFCVCEFRICDAGSRGSGSGDGGSRGSKWWRQTPFSGVMFKILLSKSNILNFELDEEGGSQNGTVRWIHPRRRGRSTPTRAAAAWRR